jgi:hypothetical protein
MRVEAQAPTRRGQPLKERVSFDWRELARAYNLSKLSAESRARLGLPSEPIDGLSSAAGPSRVPPANDLKIPYIIVLLEGLDDLPPGGRTEGGQPYWRLDTIESASAKSRLPGSEPASVNTPGRSWRRSGK